jgi:hypothetical protein
MYIVYGCSTRRSSVVPLTDPAKDGSLGSMSADKVAAMYIIPDILEIHVRTDSRWCIGVQFMGVVFL